MRPRSVSLVFRPFHASPGPDRSLHGPSDTQSGPTGRAPRLHHHINNSPFRIHDRLLFKGGSVMRPSLAGPVPAHHGEAETVTKNFEAPIPNIPGKLLIALEVDYVPGAASPAHIHAKSAFIYAYVISGAIESKVNDGETRIYRAGDSWSEAPGATHSISRNASKTEPAKLLAIFVLDTNDRALTTPIEGSR